MNFTEKEKGNLLHCINVVLNTCELAKAPIMGRILKGHTIPDERVKELEELKKKIECNMDGEEF